MYGTHVQDIVHDALHVQASNYARLVCLDDIVHVQDIAHVLCMCKILCMHSAAHVHDILHVHDMYINHNKPDEITFK